MLTEYIIKKGFGAGRTKEYFVGQRDFDIIGGIVAGPFETAVQCYEAMEALKPLYNRPLALVSGHMVAAHRCVIPELLD